MSNDIVARLRALASEFPTLDGIMDSEWTNAADEIERLRKERDEARREVCAFASGRYRKDVVTIDRAAAIAEADSRGWDCFKEVSNA